MPTPTNPHFALVDFNKLIMEEETNRRRRHHHHHHSLPTLKFRKSSTDSVPDPDIEDPSAGYTSLRDIIVKSPTGVASRSTSMAFEAGIEAAELYSAGDVIPIRNQLVRRVASMYLQSAYVLSNDRDPSFPIRLWRRLRTRACSCPCWRIMVQNPVQTFLWRMYRLFACMLRRS